MGPSAFSEIENQNVKGFIDANAPEIKFFNSIHAYSQYILLPWGWTFDVAPNYDEMYAFAERVS